MRYFDFAVEISAGNGTTYPVQVLRSPDGSAQGHMRLPFDAGELQRWREDLHPEGDRFQAHYRQVLLEKEQQAKAFGKRLFRALFTGEILERYEQSLLQARRQHEQGLRLRLRVTAPELAVLPWEYLCDPKPPGDYLCLNRTTPIVRSLEIAQPAPLQLDPPLRILVMASSPSNLDPLDTTQEQQRIDEALASLQTKGIVELRWMEGQTWRDLQNELRDGPWHGLHFIGHGGFTPEVGEGVLAFAQENGTADLLTATQVGRLLAGYPSLRLVMLNACEGAHGDERALFASPAAALASRGIPAVVAMQYDITDWAAREWTRTFYEMLAEGLPVDAAMVEARLALNMALGDSLEWATPVLYLQAADGMLFDLGAFRPRLHPRPATASFVADGSLFVQPAPRSARPRRTGLAQDSLFPEEVAPHFVPLASAVDLPLMTRIGEDTMTQDDALRTYLKAIEHIHQQGHALEHNYRPDLWKLLKQLAPGFDVINESERAEYGAPDFTIARATQHGPLRIGYVEAKKIGESLDKIERTDQLKRYRSAIPNLVLTNHLEFRWYVNGDLRMAARLATLRANTKMIWDAEGAPKVALLLQAFLDQQPEPIRQPKELAERMARLAHSIRTLIVEAFEKGGASETLRDLHQAFKDVLIPDLSVSDFADMFAQTLAYGLFAARQSHASSRLFSRQDAAHEIPRTNPFLRRLFGTITGPDLDGANFIGFVDDLAQLLALTDMDAVLADFGKRTRQEDPIVHFYETFLSAYDPKLRELRGVYYTPEPVVSYLVRSVDHLLRTDFACADGLADTSTTTVIRAAAEGQTATESAPRVLLLDPACGTGTFTYAVINLIRDTYRAQGNAGMWSSYVREHLLPRLFSFELLMAPYAVAHLKLGMQLAAMDLPEAERSAWAYDFEGNERLGIFLTNTLEEAARRSDLLMGRYISDEANEAARVKKDDPVMVVLGNPPYSGHSANKGEWITNLLHGKDGESPREVGNYFKVDGQPLGEQNPKMYY
jgi:hypothetical protein